MEINDEQWAWILTLDKWQKSVLKRDVYEVGAEIHVERRLCDFCDNYSIGETNTLGGQVWYCENHNKIGSMVCDMCVTFYSNGVEINKIR